MSVFVFVYICYIYIGMYLHIYMHTHIYSPHTVKFNAPYFAFSRGIKYLYISYLTICLCNFSILISKEFPMSPFYGCMDKY